ncbi:hypothetical protein U9M48_013547, partial [Paspalum notatum var. saurae]
CLLPDGRTASVLSRTPPPSTPRPHHLSPAPPLSIRRPPRPHPLSAAMHASSVPCHLRHPSPPCRRPPLPPSLTHSHAAHPTRPPLSSVVDPPLPSRPLRPRVPPPSPVSSLSQICDTGRWGLHTAIARQWPPNEARRLSFRQHHVVPLPCPAAPRPRPFACWRSAL